MKEWSGIAFNPVPSSPNEIHSDEMAQKFGFKGGLVPGVTVAAYTIHPAVEYWGKEWLRRGNAHVQIKSPLYDGEEFSVKIIESDDTRYLSHLERPDGTISAVAQVSLPNEKPVPPTRRGDPFIVPDASLTKAAPETMLALKENGCFSMEETWDDQHPLWRYLKDGNTMPKIHRIDSGEGLANMSFILGCSNWIMAKNIYLNPWVHMETTSQNYREISLGTKIVVELEINELFTKKGHEFVDAIINLFDTKDNSCLTSINLRAIYQLRGV